MAKGLSIGHGAEAHQAAAPFHSQPYGFGLIVAVMAHPNLVNPIAGAGQGQGGQAGVAIGSLCCGVFQASLGG